MISSSVTNGALYPLIIGDVSKLCADIKEAYTCSVASTVLHARCSIFCNSSFVANMFLISVPAIEYPDNTSIVPDWSTVNSFRLLIVGGVPSISPGNATENGYPNAPIHVYVGTALLSVLLAIMILP